MNTQRALTWIAVAGWMAACAGPSTAVTPGEICVVDPRSPAGADSELQRIDAFLQQGWGASQDQVLARHAGLSEAEGGAWCSADELAKTCLHFSEQGLDRVVVDYFPDGRPKGLPGNFVYRPGNFAPELMRRFGEPQVRTQVTTVEYEWTTSDYRLTLLQAADGDARAPSWTKRLTWQRPPPAS